MRTLGLRLLVVMVMLALLFPVAAAAPVGGPDTAKTLDRDADPVIVRGESLPGFLGLPLGQLFVYAWQEGQWSQIPWQFDEVKNGG
ncbi:MAG: hypothetical protein J5I90_02615 [Caldilineales bacterium]|nr:hypothetical protein [Caldilineales bacterium]